VRFGVVARVHCASQRMERSGLIVMTDVTAQIASEREGA
jgi:hypothetical protein